MTDFTALKARRLAKENHQKSPASTPLNPVEDVKKSAIDESEQPSELPSSTSHTVSVPKASSSKPSSSSPSQIGLPPSLEVRTTSSKGRTVHTRQSISPGQTIFATTPLISVLDNKNLYSRCSNCYTTSNGSEEHLTCSKCKVLRYCSRECQLADWVLHKSECLALQAYSKAKETKGKVPDTPVRALGRIVWARLKRGEEFGNQIDSLVSLRETLSEATKTSFFYLSVALSSYVTQSTLQSLYPNSTSIFDLLSRFTANSFSLTDPQLNSIGVSISPLTALFNHSCSPNAVVVFPLSLSSSSQYKNFMHLIAISPIAPGGEILTSYVDLSLPKTLRQSSLKEQYGFFCDCEMCGRREVDEEWVDPRESWACPTVYCEKGDECRGDEKCCGGKGKKGGKRCQGRMWLPNVALGGLVERTCSKCRRSRSVDAAALGLLYEKATGAIKLLVSLDVSDHSALDTARDSSISIIKQLSSYQLPCSYPTFQLLQALTTTLVSAHQFPTALLFAEPTNQGACEIYPSGHPALAVNTALLGKLMVRGRHVDNERAYWDDEAGFVRTQEVLRKALKEVEVGFGRNSQLFKEVRETMIDQEEGMAMARQVRNSQG